MSDHQVTRSRAADGTPLADCSCGARFAGPTPEATEGLVDEHLVASDELGYMAILTVAAVSSVALAADLALSAGHAHGWAKLGFALASMGVVLVWARFTHAVSRRQS